MNSQNEFNGQFRTIESPPVNSENIIFIILS